MNFMEKMENAITNEQGQVAMKWILPRPPKQVKIEGSNRVYVFTYSWNVCMAWVNAQDVERMLLVKEKVCNCNNGTYKNAFVLCNQLDVNLWTYGNREGIPQ